MFGVEGALAIKLEGLFENMFWLNIFFTERREKIILGEWEQYPHYLGEGIIFRYMCNMYVY